LNNPSVVTELARIVFDVCAVVPGGVLVFVSSYAVLQKLQAGLDSSGLMKQLKLIKVNFKIIDK
jgi:Rad3-related DNA helicase